MKEQSTFVFSRPEYTGEEGYVEPAQYTCCNCGERIEKKNLADHATMCKDPYEKTAEAIERSEKRTIGVKCSVCKGEKQVIDRVACYGGEHTEIFEDCGHCCGTGIEPGVNECEGCGTVHKKLNEVDYSKLRSGMKVKIKSWKRMVEEYGVDDAGHIKRQNTQVAYSTYMKKYCDQIIEINNVDVKDEDVKFKGCDRYYFPFSCIESIIEEPQEPKQAYCYNEPKTVKALWLGQTEGDVEYKDIYTLWQENYWIGFKHENKIFGKYTITSSDSKKIGAVKGSVRFHDFQENDILNGTYYIFNSSRDLYLWMAEGEE